ncbi:hypothetical protein IAQ61_001121, partial [Plenodomus lingam]|uniref:uncharacterized protein n=1 Tax=Leptosphaeria maculans TaxID=5022 RepID=UPI00331D0F3C
MENLQARTRSSSHPIPLSTQTPRQMHAETERPDPMAGSLTGNQPLSLGCLPAYQQRTSVYSTSQSQPQAPSRHTHNCVGIARPCIHSCLARGVCTRSSVGMLIAPATSDIAETSDLPREERETARIHVTLRSRVEHRLCTRDPSTGTCTCLPHAARNACMFHLPNANPWYRTNPIRFSSTAMKSHGQPFLPPSTAPTGPSPQRCNVVRNDTHGGPPGWVLQPQRRALVGPGSTMAAASSHVRPNSYNKVQSVQRTRTLALTWLSRVDAMQYVMHTGRHDGVESSRSPHQVGISVRLWLEFAHIAQVVSALTRVVQVTNSNLRHTIHSTYPSSVRSGLQPAHAPSPKRTSQEAVMLLHEGIRSIEIALSGGVGPTQLNTHKRTVTAFMAVPKPILLDWTV